MKLTQGSQFYSYLFEIERRTFNCNFSSLFVNTEIIHMEQNQFGSDFIGEFSILKLSQLVNTIYKREIGRVFRLLFLSTEANIAGSLVQYV